MTERTIAHNLPKQTFLSKTGRVLIRLGRNLSRRTTIVEIICSLLIILFIYTGLNKIMDYEKFKFEMGKSPFIQPFAGFIAVIFPPGELLIALLLMFKRTRMLGLYFSFSLMALFTGYIWIMLNYAFDLPCSCGGIISKMSWQEHLAFNSVFTGLACISVLLQKKISQDNKNQTGPPEA